MRVPGGNLLGMASRLIGLDKIDHWKFQKNVEDGAGVLQPIYATAPLVIYGSVQPVPRSMYEQNGLDFQRDFFNVYTSAVLSDLRRDKAPDMLDWNGRRFNVESKTDWAKQDGWKGALCCDIGPTPV